jgi:hypothetical protein
MITQIILNGHQQKKCLEAADAEGTLAIAHDDDLQIVKSKDLVRTNRNAELRGNSYSNARTKETVTADADAVLKFLHENEIPVLIENGGK